METALLFISGISLLQSLIVLKTLGWEKTALGLFLLNCISILLYLHLNSTPLWYNTPFSQDDGFTTQDWISLSILVGGGIYIFLFMATYHYLTDAFTFGESWEGSGYLWELVIVLLGIYYAVCGLFDLHFEAIEKYIPLLCLLPFGLSIWNFISEDEGIWFVVWSVLGMTLTEAVVGMSFVKSFVSFAHSGVILFEIAAFVVALKWVYFGEFSSAGGSSSLSSRPRSTHSSGESRYGDSSYSDSSEPTMKVTFKGTYQMNGPKPFSRTFECSSSEARVYSNYASDKSLQESWIRTNFPGAQTHRGFTCSVNIRKK